MSQDAFNMGQNHRCTSLGALSVDPEFGFSTGFLLCCFYVVSS